MSEFHSKWVTVGISVWREKQAIPTLHFYCNHRVLVVFCSMNSTAWLLAAMTLYTTQTIELSKLTHHGQQLLKLHNVLVMFCSMGYDSYNKPKSFRAEETNPPWPTTSKTLSRALELHFHGIMNCTCTNFRGWNTVHSVLTCAEFLD